jgi:hypothetical protein
LIKRNVFASFILFKKGTKTEQEEEVSELGEKRRKFLAPFASCKIFYGKTCGTEIQLPHTFGVIKEENFLLLMVNALRIKGCFFAP